MISKNATNHAKQKDTTNFLKKNLAMQKRHDQNVDVGDYCDREIQIMCKIKDSNKLTEKSVGGECVEGEGDETTSPSMNKKIT